MRKTLLAAVMAASALIPAAALAQDAPDRPQRGDGQGRPQRQATPGAEGRTQWQRPQGQPQVQQPARAAVQAQVQAPVQVQQQRPDRGGRPDGQGGRTFGGRRDYRGEAQVQGQAQVQAAPVQQARGPGDDRRGGRPDFNGGQRGGRADFNDGQRGDRGGFNGQQRGGDPRANDRGFQQNGGTFRGNDGRGYSGNRNTGAWSRDWRRDNRYNYNVYRNQNRSAFHLPRYYAPYGWGGGYRRFGVGFSLSSVLYGQDYWIDDADYYRLPPAYGPYRWVRYYNDALLVDIRTGYVVDTVYDIFW